MALRTHLRWGMILALVSPFMFSGMSCEEEEGPAPAAPEATDETKKPAKEGAEAKPAEAVAGDLEESDTLGWSYNPVGRRDPFRSPITNEVVAGPDVPETPLQKYEIDQYKLVGVIWGVDNPTAMVEDPEGMGHFLQRDTLIGKNWGKVVRITPQEVIVAEEYRDFEGKLIVNEIPLKLPTAGKE